MRAFARLFQMNKNVHVPGLRAMHGIHVATIDAVRGPGQPNDNELGTPCE